MVALKLKFLMIVVLTGILVVNIIMKYGPLAQLAEPPTHNWRDPGSNPGRTTKIADIA